MTLRIIRLGEPRRAREGTRIGTVRRPPRGVRKSRYAADDWFDVLVSGPRSKRGTDGAQGKMATTETEWKRFVRAFKAEMNVPAARRTLDLLAALSHAGNLSRLLLRKRGALPPVCAS